MSALRPLPNALPAVDASTAIATNLAAHAAAARGAYASNTERALQADVALFTVLSQIFGWLRPGIRSPATASWDDGQ